MASIYARGNQLWCRLKDESGTWISKRTPHQRGDEAKADRYAAAAQRMLDSRRANGASAGPTTVRAYADTWIPKRREADLDWTNDQGRLKNHVLPVIGRMLLADVHAPQIASLFHGIRCPKDPADKVAQRTVYNIYSVVSAMFRDAELEGLIEKSPCILTKAQLGPLRDKDPEWRESAVFARNQIETLISHPRIPFDRRIVYGLESLAGVRPGEASALRWRHYDPAVEPLGKLFVAHAYNTRKHRTKGTKTEVVKHVPVHPTLAAMLAEWKLSGWAAMVGRQPGPDDLIVPLPPSHAARRRSRKGEAFRGHDYSGKRWREDDLPLLGWKHHRHYDLRATFITLALEDGADPDIIEKRVTHTKKSRSAFDGYNRGLQWAKTCAEVSKLKITRKVIPAGNHVERASTTDALATPFATASAVVENDNENVVEAAGVEPASGNASGLTSTRVGSPFDVSRPPAAAGLRARRAG